MPSYSWLPDDMYREFQIKQTLKYPYQIHLRNIHKSTTAQVLYDHFPKFDSFAKLRIWDRGTHKAVGKADYGKEEDAKAVAEHIAKIEDWSWNSGFRVKINGLKTFYAKEGEELAIGGARFDDLKLRVPDFIGETWDDVLEDLKSGCILMLPLYRHRKDGFRVDARFKMRQYGHPVMIVGNLENGLVNIVMCTSFGSRSIAEVYLDDPKFGASSVRRYIEIDSGTAQAERRDGKQESFLGPQKLLTFGGDNQMARKTYAGTVVYTVELQALIRLESFAISGCGWQHVPGGYLKVNNAEILLERIKEIGEDPMALHETVVVVS